MPSSLYHKKSNNNKRCSCSSPRLD